MCSDSELPHRYELLMFLKSIDCDWFAWSSLTAVLSKTVWFAVAVISYCSNASASSNINSSQLHQWLLLHYRCIVIKYYDISWWICLTTCFDVYFFYRSLIQMWHLILQLVCLYLIYHIEVNYILQFIHRTCWCCFIEDHPSSVSKSSIVIFISKIDWTA